MDAIYDFSCAAHRHDASVIFYRADSTMLHINPGSKSKEGEHHGASQRWRIPKAGRREGGQRVNWIGSVLFCAKKYPLIFCGRFEMTWKQIGYAKKCPIF